MNYSGKFFDGNSSTGHTADIRLNTFDIDICYTDSSFQDQQVKWNTDKIHKTDFAEHDKAILKYGDFPFQYLEVSDKGFEAELKRMYPMAAFHKSAYNWVFAKGAAALIAMAAIFLLLMAGTYFYVVPWIAERFALSLPVEWESELGESVYSKMVSEEEVSGRNTELMSTFFSRLNYKSEYKIKPVVVKDDIVNAYALPGGRMVIYEGILRKMDSYEELSALLSHEYSHIALKHSTKNIARSLSSGLLLSVLFGDASGITAIVIQNADALKQLGYSRELESEADKNGLTLMKQRQIDPRGMKQLFVTLKEESGDEPESMKFLSTHPLTDQRIQFVENEIENGVYIVTEDAVLDSIFKEIKYNLDE